MLRIRHDCSTFVLSCLTKIPPEDRVIALDAPCGFGRHTFELLRQGYAVTAADINKDRLEFVRNKLNDQGSIGQCVTVVKDIETRRPFAEKSVDVALVVDYASEAGIRNVLRAVRPGGFTVIETFRANGGNWLDLPQPGAFSDMIRKTFTMIEYRERAAGPTGAEAASVLCFARRQ